MHSENLLSVDDNDLTTVLLNKHDNSDTQRESGLTVCYCFGISHILKNEAEATLEKMVEADSDCDVSQKYANLSYLIFPRNRSVIAILSCPECIRPRART